MTRRAVYAGSFDPPTLGHAWMIAQAAKLFDEVLVVVGTNPAKDPIFTADERTCMLVDIIVDARHDAVRVAHTRNNELLVNWAKANNCQYLIRGVRDVTDFGFEWNMRQANSSLNPDIETVYLIPPASLAHVSSSAVKSILGCEKWKDAICNFVPPSVATFIAKKVEKRDAIMYGRAK